ncbi:macro domain-containing protein [Candidatus Micrarchaeota archaeon]|nr:macro domain-containing protein [Candidatus Micrarchaeota archaeon]
MIKIIKGDITQLKTDIIVNAADEFLDHGGGIAFSIVRAGGYKIKDESREWINRHGPLKVGEVAVTTAGKLDASKIIHVVGPRGTNPELLEKAIRNVLEKARELGARTVAMPAVSCGVFGFDKKRGAEIIYKICKRYVDLNIFLISIDSEVIKYWQELDS